MTITVSYFEDQRVNFIALWVQTLLLGAYAIIFVVASHLLLIRRRTAEGGNLRYTLVVTVVLFGLATASVVVDFVQTLLSSFTAGGTLNNSTGDPNDPSLSVINRNNIMSTVGIFLTVMTNFVADCLLTWRCYTIWGRRRAVIAVPIFLIAVGTAAGVGLGGLYAKVTLLYQSVFFGTGSISPELMSVLLTWQNALSEVFYAMTFAGNVLMTGLIALRILWVTRHMRGSSTGIDTSLYANIIALFMESGGIHSLCLLFSIVGYSSTLAGMEVFVRCNQPISALECDTEIYHLQTIASSAAAITAGLSPTLIVVMLASGRTADQTTAAKTTMAFAAPPPALSEHTSHFRVTTSGGRDGPDEIEGDLHDVQVFSLSKEQPREHPSIN
ncbi:hypothetical protein NEOLEDRAFT_578293 [Neolentinus lepideus HHB14362 ss-1]|uniref:Uncharacterized protein n=1 Tax=Neolentinus lepideus HHB14362 ss-1 TaxID=1314782 RepID=A0A165QXR8_9AGAM|nr:hypothetical protein NEOLEDRAFT_578293 [Neolentinus lepideus HHB14362 ss-1]